MGCGGGRWGLLSSSLAGALAKRVTSLNQTLSLRGEINAVARRQHLKGSCPAAAGNWQLPGGVRADAVDVLRARNSRGLCDEVTAIPWIFTGRRRSNSLFFRAV